MKSIMTDPVATRPAAEALRELIVATADPTRSVFQAQVAKVDGQWVVVYAVGSAD